MSWKKKNQLLCFIVIFLYIELFTVKLSANSANTLRGVKIVRIEAECTTVTGVTPIKICESGLKISIKNITRKPQRYLVIKANIFDKKGNELTNDSCFSGYEIIDIRKKLLPNAKVYVQTHFRKYFEYGTAELSKVEWYGLREPDFNKVYPEVKNECP
ncbi:hypothetical protein H6G93_18075 [Nostoc sp. FACHB-973]|nr:hypothetical protein [Nostoc sp. FACHB-973]